MHLYLQALLVSKIYVKFSFVWQRYRCIADTRSNPIFDKFTLIWDVSFSIFTNSYIRSYEMLDLLMFFVQCAIRWFCRYVLFTCFFYRIFESVSLYDTQVSDTLFNPSIYRALCFFYKTGAIKSSHNISNFISWTLRILTQQCKTEEPASFPIILLYHESPLTDQVQ